MNEILSAITFSMTKTNSLLPIDNDLLLISSTEHQLSQIEKQLISCNSALQKETQDSDQTKKRLEETGKYLFFHVHLGVFSF